MLDDPVLDYNYLEQILLCLSRWLFGLGSGSAVSGFLGLQFRITLLVESRLFRKVSLMLWPNVRLLWFLNLIPMALFIVDALETEHLPSPFQVCAKT
jgi:hypothetical protein